MGEGCPLKDIKYPLLYKNTRIISTMKKIFASQNQKKTKIVKPQIWYSLRQDQDTWVVPLEDLGGYLNSFLGFLWSLK